MEVAEWLFWSDAFTARQLFHKQKSGSKCFRGVFTSEKQPDERKKEEPQPKTEMTDFSMILQILQSASVLLPFKTEWRKKNISVCLFTKRQTSSECHLHCRARQLIGLSEGSESDRRLVELNPTDGRAAVKQTD